MSDIVSTAGRFTRSPSFKFFLIAFLVLLLLIPLVMVGGLVSEREGRARSVTSAVARTWGSMQQLTGPYLVVPYTVRVEVQEGDKIVQRTSLRRAVFLPDELTFTADAKSGVLHRSIFDINVYTATVDIVGRFAAPDFADVAPDALEIRWQEATISLALNDVSGLKDAAMLSINGQDKLPFQPSIGIPGANLRGIHARLTGAPSAATSEAKLAAFDFQAELHFTGSSSLNFAPAGRETRVAVTSDWPHPSFNGAFLPIERNVTAEGFSAKWRIPHLARSVPQSWTTMDGGFDRFLNYQFGVSLNQPVDFYALVTRAVKYGVLFLAIAFMAVFVLELVSKKRVHAVQYVFVGLAMVFFYVLLLSFSEHVGFTIAYIIASAATGGMLAIYVAKSLSSTSSGLLMAIMFALLYGFLFLILQLEDYALLAGALLGFAALTAVMFATLRVDWSGLGPATSPARDSLSNDV